jgi:F-type H+-transporting ATPase subunit gamma
METLQQLARRIDGARKLLSVVRTMKTLAALNLRHDEEAVVSIAAYRETVETGLRMLFHEHPEHIPSGVAPAAGERLGVVALGSDQGMCGGFNERLVTHLTDYLAGRPEPSKVVLLVVGQRLAGGLEEAGPAAEACEPVPSSVAGIDPVVRRILVRVEGWQAQRRVDRVLLAYNRATPRAASLPAGSAERLGHALGEPTVERLLPPDPAWLASLQTRRWPSRSLPVVTMAPDALLAALVRELLFAAFFSACAQSMASENASRLAAMESAQRNVEDRLDELHHQFHAVRQSSITAELLELVSGFEAAGVAQA